MKSISDSSTAEDLRKSTILCAFGCDARMEEASSWPLIREVLLTGPADGQDILDHIKTHDLWETLYVASRSSPYAARWREAFGRERIDHDHPRSVLLLATQKLVSIDNTSSAKQQDSSVELLSKFIANCCAENVNARRAAIEAGVLKPLLRALKTGCDPNIFIPAIYNVCTELEAEEDIVLADLTIDYQNVTLYDVEVRLARCDEPDGGVYNGLYVLMKPDIIANITDDILDYLTELIDMVSKTISVAQSGHIPSNDSEFGPPLALLLKADSGRRLASRSELAHNAVCRALISMTISGEVQLFVAINGLILDITMLAGSTSQNGEDDMYDDDVETRSYDSTKVHTEAVREHQKASFLRLTYAIAQLPQFEEHISYGVAREALKTIEKAEVSYTLAIAYIMLYTFVNNEQRAHLLIGEGLLSPLFHTLKVQDDLQVIHPACALLAKCSTMWSLKTRLVNNGAIQAIQRLLLASNLGFEVPSTAVTIITLLLKGHPRHVELLLDEQHSGVLKDILRLFDKGNQTICLDIGGLFVEICATLGTSMSEAAGQSTLNLEWFVSACSKQELIKIFTFVAKTVDTKDISSNRIWYALGLLVVSGTCFDIAGAVSQDPDVAQKMQNIESNGGPLADNIRFVKVHLSRVQQLANHDNTFELDQTMQQMTLS